RDRPAVAPSRADARRRSRRPARIGPAEREMLGFTDPAPQKQVASMPLYEYECDACEHRFEVIQKFSDPPVERCPSCGGPVHKLQSAPAIQFKGSGFYITDYAKKDHSAKTEGGSTETTSGKSGAKQDTADGKKSSSGDKSAASDKSSTTGESASASAP